MAAKAWKSLVKKVDSFNQQYPGSSVVCMGLVSNSYVVAGSDEMKVLFLNKPEVEALYKQAVLGQSFNDQPVQQAVVPEIALGMRDVLNIHVYDMETGLMRSVLASVVSPTDAVSNKDGRRNFYVEENCPQWWKDTGIRFQSVNHAPGGGKRLAKTALMVLLESLQRSLGIVPMPPKKQNRTEFTSTFIYSDNETLEQPEAAGGEEQQEAAGGEEQQEAAGGEEQQQAAGGEEQQQAAGGEEQQQAGGVEEQQQAAGGEEQQQAAGGEEQQQAGGVEEQQQAAGGEEQQQAAGGEEQQQAAGGEEQQQAAGGEEQQQAAGGEEQTEAAGGEEQTEAAGGEGTEVAGQKPQQTGCHDSIVSQIRDIFEKQISWTEKCLLVMRNIKTWDQLDAVSGIITDYLPEIPQQLANKWKAQKLTDVNKRFSDFIPSSVGERIVFQSSADGNCIFNTVSIILYGDESYAMMLKLAAVINMVDYLIPFAKYFLEEFKGDITLWVNQATRGTFKDNLNETDIANIFQIELMETVHQPYQDGSLFHLHMLAHLLKRPIQQHCSKKTFESYQQLLFPPFGKLASPSPIHVVWVPASPRNRYATISHVVPAVCFLGQYGCHLEECAFLGLGLCGFAGDFNQGKSTGAVECTICGQWVHDVCIGVEAAKYSETDAFPCGCDILLNGLVPLKDNDFYQSLTLEDVDLDLKALLEKVVDKVSLRNDLFRRHDNERMKDLLRYDQFGPFTTHFIDSVTAVLYKLIVPTEHYLVYDIYLPEVLLAIITKFEDINQLLAEMVLAQKFCKRSS